MKSADNRICSALAGFVARRPSQAGAVDGTTILIDLMQCFRFISRQDKSSARWILLVLVYLGIWVIRSSTPRCCLTVWITMHWVVDFYDLHWLILLLSSPGTFLEQYWTFRCLMSDTFMVLSPPPLCKHAFSTSYFLQDDSSYPSNSFVMTLESVYTDEQNTRHWQAIILSDHWENVAVHWSDSTSVDKT